MNDVPQNFVDNELYFDVQRFLFAEASLLDRRQYDRWVKLLADEIHYAVYVAVSREVSAEPVEYAIVDEGAVGLRSRIDQLSNSKLTRAENPASQTRRFISNIEATSDSNSTEVQVVSNLLLYRGRPSIEANSFYVGERQDLLRKNGVGWLIVRRAVRLDHTTILDGALSVLL